MVALLAGWLICMLGCADGHTMLSDTVLDGFIMPSFMQPGYAFKSLPISGPSGTNPLGFRCR